MKRFLWVSIPLFVLHFVAAFVGWSITPGNTAPSFHQDLVSRYAWSVLSFPVFYFLPESLSLEYFWEPFILNSALWAIVAWVVLSFLWRPLNDSFNLRGTRERSQRIIGCRVHLAELESGPLGLDPNQPRLPPANVESFGPDGQYSLRFQLPVTWLGKLETHATISSRHVGYPVSLAAGFYRRRIVVAGYFGSGEAFIGILRVLKESEG